MGKKYFPSPSFFIHFAANCLPSYNSESKGRRDRESNEWKNSSHRWWVNWRDPIFNEDRAVADDFETGKELRRTESEPDLTFNYSKLTGEIDGDDEIVVNGNINIVKGRNKEATKTRRSASGTARASAASRGSRRVTGTRTQTATSAAGGSRDIR